MSNAGSSSSSGTTTRGQQPSHGRVPSSLQKRFPRIAFVANKIITSRTGRTAGKAWSYRRPLFFGFFATYTAVGYLKLKRDAYLRDIIHPDTYLVWKIYDGSIVESRGPPSVSALINAPAAGEEAPRVMEMFEVIRALKWAQADERIKGIFADFSGLHLPSSVTPNRLGLAQIEELMQAIHEFKLAKKQQHGEKARPSIAWADTFNSQGSFLLASSFDELWMQPAGSIPLTGLGAQIPFFKKVLDYFGIKVLAEARREYKSMVSTFSREESLPAPQIQNEAELLGELNRGLVHAVAVNRFPDEDPDVMSGKVETWMKEGPFSTREAKELGLINGAAFKRDIVKRLVDPKHGGHEETKFKSLHHYNKVNDRHLEHQLTDDEIVQVGVVYLLGGISSAPGEFSTSSVLKGLKEAAENEDVKSIVLRIDSGGGDVVASESIWDAVRRVREDYGKPVVASFGNAAASGGYYAASAADAIVACENTITGSIGVASLRPTITRAFFEKFNVGIQSFFTGSTSQSTLHELNEAQRAKSAKHIDEMYNDFLQKVCDGRNISRDVIESLAGGRVMTGFSAWARCNPDAEIEQVQLHPAATPQAEKIVEHAQNAEKAPESKESEQKEVQESVKSAIRRIKAVSLTSQWKTQEVNASSGNNTIMIERVGPTQSSSLSNSESINGGEHNGILSELIAKAEAALKVKSDTYDNVSATAAQSSHDSSSKALTGAEKLKKRMEEEETRLAVAAHSAAEESRKSASDSDVEIKTEGVLAGESGSIPDSKIGPYGKGLVDSIGGIWDSAYYAMTLALQAEIEAMITKDNLTLDQATAKIRPGADREVTEDGMLALATDLRLVRFPEDKPFWKKVQEMNAKGDQPQLSLLPRAVTNTFALMLNEAGERAARAAVRMMIATAADPSGIAAAFDDPQLAERLRAKNGLGAGNTTGRARAEYPLASLFT
ncbi:related to Signal peptide peptidase [Melanopsichium pennsylvanicum]|uniref:Related to Signal peptide peptidase n=2 Tax=Melanopsichium pennsylvanicum TaxID=63383 RepID=A0AAJ4XNS2_9BASI|nr:related to Signal peptide peptidase [Melanopsichium pennsylvanicum 4]SNX86015.1 related to Signal peptide peptidase [Melanopsichium pennsylvanicum]